MYTCQYLPSIKCSITGEYVELGSTKGTRIEKCQKDPFSRIKQKNYFTNGL